MWKLLQVCFLFVHPRKILHSENFLLNLEPTSSIRRIGEFYRQTRTPFKHIFVKKKNYSIVLYLTRENGKTARTREKRTKQSFATEHVLSLWAIDELGEINCFRR